VNWRTGEVTPGEHLGAGMPSVVGGRAVVSGDAGNEVVDVAAGDVLFESKGWLRLSPDGRYAVASAAGLRGGGGTEVRDLDRGTSVTVGDQPVLYGWTADDQLVGIVSGELNACSPDTGDCTSSPLPEGVDPNAFLR